MLFVVENLYFFKNKLLLEDTYIYSRDALNSSRDAENHNN